MIETVIKRNGTQEPFSAEKLNKWAEYATSVGGNWSYIAQQTFKRLPKITTSQQIHQTMIDVCVDKATLEYSRVAAQLLRAEINKNMSYLCGVNEDSTFQEILEVYEELNVWDSGIIPPYNPIWEGWYNEFKKEFFEYWQLVQWTEKYSMNIQDYPIETPILGYMGIALALYGDTDKAYRYAKALCQGKINLPTPALNGLRNGDWDTISCCVISGGDSVDSIGVADHIAYKMTAKKAGIGIELTTRSIKDPVKGGRVAHLGKWSLFKKIDRSVKAMTQITRGGNATVTVTCIDPEIENILLWKSQRMDIEQRIDKLDYSFAYNDAFVEAVKSNGQWHLFSYLHAPELWKMFYTASADQYNAKVNELIAKGVPHKTINAMDLLKRFLTVRKETGRFYDVNVTRMNTHTPFLDTIVQSNLCLEIALPTKPYVDMFDLYANEYSIGETAFCSLSGVNVMKVKPDEYEEIAELALEAVDIMIDNAPMMTRTMRNDILRRRSVGVGIVGLAGLLYENGLDYNGSKESLEMVQKVAEYHYYYLLKASQKLAKQSGVRIQGIDEGWLPIDTAINKPLCSELDWEALRGKARKHSVLVAHMPTESSSLLVNAPNGLYPVRSKVTYKKSRKGLVPYICELFDDSKHISAYDVDNINMSRYYARVQDFTDQAISADHFINPEKHVNGKVKMSQLIREWVAHTTFGNKTKYYYVTKDTNGGSMQDTVKRTETEIKQAFQLPPELVGGDDDSCCKL